MSEKEPIRVLSVDDHEIMRGGIRYLLLAVEDVKLVGEACSGVEALELCESLNPDVVLMDMRMPGMDGIETSHLIHNRFPKIKILALTSFEEEDMIRDAMQAGVIGYLQKGISIDELAAAIRSAHEGKPTLSPKAFRTLVESSATPSQIPDFSLTERELEVLKMLVEGLPNMDIAKRLVISLATVKYHIGNILKKLDCKNRTEAAAFAIEHNLVSKN